MQKDKILHFVVSLILCCGGMAAIVYLWEPDMCFIAPLATLAIGVLKELVDAATDGADFQTCIKDFLADLFGTVAGCLLFLLIFFICK